MDSAKSTDTGGPAAIVFGLFLLFCAAALGIVFALRSVGAFLLGSVLSRQTPEGDRTRRLKSMQKYLGPICPAHILGGVLVIVAWLVPGGYVALWAGGLAVSAGFLIDAILCPFADYFNELLSGIRSTEDCSD